MEKFEVNILGCGSALPTIQHFGSMQVVNVKERLYMIDCAEGAQLQLRKSRLAFSKINNIFISHMHGDHCFGLIGLISTFSLLGRTSVLNVYGPADLRTILSELLHWFCPQLNYKVEIHTVDTRRFDKIFEDKSVEIYTIPLKHRMECCGFLFKEKQELPHIKRDVIDAFGIPVCYINNIKNGMDYEMPDGEIIPNSLLTTPPRPARSYAYCTDTLFRPGNADLLQGVDLLYHESTFSNKDAAFAKKTYHSTAGQAGEMAALCHAKKLVIGHFSARYKNESLLLEEAKRVFENTVLARENLCITI
ncbi:MAG: ribonuclease Z [Roseburia sp.]|nr:ribonuclease Z [Roseburia sp.]MCM1420077.1 ribonuclease Z [Bacteroides sp.]